jgi:membrane protein YqaA with SNARE-associated domain
MTEHLLGSFGLYGGTLVVCFISGLVPIVNAELFLVGVSALTATTTAELALVAGCAAVGQMTAKVLLYYAGMGMFEFPRGRFRARIESARTYVERWRRRPYLVFAVSATLGLPPFFLVSVAAGALRVGFRAFCSIGLIGRFVRFAVVVAIPHIR